MESGKEKTKRGKVIFSVLYSNDWLVDSYHTSHQMGFSYRLLALKNCTRSIFISVGIQKMTVVVAGDIEDEVRTRS